MIAETEQSGVVRHAVSAMGTRFELVLDAGPMGRSMAGAIAEEAGELILDWHDRLSAFARGSVVGVLNASGGAWVRLDGEVAELLAACFALHDETGGTFDPTLGAAMRAAGHRGESGAAVTGEAAFGLAALELDGAWARLTRPGVELDLGGIAKGHALDLVAELLREHGGTSALAHGGTSTAIAVGCAPDGSPWRVRLGPMVDAPVVELVDRAMSVSAIAGRVADGNGHVLDPRTGRAVSHRAQAAVVGKSARWCDAWSTALLVLDDGDAVEPSGGEWMVWKAIAGERVVGERSDDGRRD